MAYTNIDDPSAYFQAKTYTGTSGIHDVTLDGNSDMQPDFVWFKNRTVGYVHHLYDSSRGVTKALYSNGTNAEATISNGLTRFDPDGFRVSSAAAINEDEIVCWNWKANGGTTSTNTDGTLSTTVQANQDAGFSIVQWTGVGGIRTVGHGLGQAPAMVICKNRTLSTQWLIWHQGLTGPGYQLLFTTGAMGGPGGNLVRQTPTSTVFEIGTSAEVSNDCIAYCFASKQGYSKFGKYVGNGNADGPFVYTGFKPAFLIMKRTDSTGNWVMFDTKRDTHNVTKHRLFPNLTNADNTTRNYIDLLSNGFKMRNTDVDHNASGATIIYMAFAENPFTTSTGVPCTAR
jgi:hypothetical protein